MKTRIGKAALLAGALLAVGGMGESFAAYRGSGQAEAVNAAAALDVLLGADVNAAVGPLPAGISGTAPPDFNRSGTAAGAQLVVGGIGPLLSTGALSASTQSNLAAGTVTATADADDVGVTVGPLLSLAAAEVSSTATLTCNAGTAVPSGSSELTGLG